MVSVLIWCKGNLYLYFCGSTNLYQPPPPGHVSGLLNLKRFGCIQFKLTLTVYDSNLSFSPGQIFFGEENCIHLEDSCFCSGAAMSHWKEKDLQVLFHARSSLKELQNFFRKVQIYKDGFLRVHYECCYLARGCSHLRIKISNCIAPSHHEIWLLLISALKLRWQQNLYLFFCGTRCGSSLECWMTTEKGVRFGYSW